MKSEENASVLNEKQLEGLTKPEVLAKLESVKAEFRVLKEDDNVMMGTMDYKENRYNLYINNNFVTKVTKG